MCGLIRQRFDQKKKGLLKVFNYLFVCKIMDKLQMLFSGYADSPPYAFVLCGNFLSQPKYGLRCDELTDGFKKLADLICKFNLIKENSQFVFIPGPQDPGVVKIYPR
jgi:DNA polymerase epsilon subunit 2